jgi:1-aminocyclopropane-1-carboxylate deaminase/D-cysteine desulfhydrase-like pyridoxal-dependent ACC family enzyme
MNKIVITALLLSQTISLYAQDGVSTTDNNSTIIKAQKIEKQLQEQIKKEEKFAKEQRFYQGEHYDLSYAEVDPDVIDSVPLIEPDYDFDMDDVYD